MQAAASVAENHLGRVLYLDTGNSFSARRIAQFICSSSDATLGQCRKSWAEYYATRSMTYIHCLIRCKI